MERDGAEHEGMDFVEFVAKQRKLVEREREAELEATRVLLQSRSHRHLVRSGVRLARLSVEESCVVLGGRVSLRLGVAGAAQHGSGELLPPHRFTSGDTVEVYEAGRALGADGGKKKQSNGEEAAQQAKFSAVVQSSTRDSITVVLNEQQQEGDASLDERSLLQMDLVVNDVTYKRLRSVLNYLEQHAKSASAEKSRLYNVLLGNAPPTFGAGAHFHPINAALNELQRRAVQRCLDAHQLSIIHGPPGTGKTTAVVELIQQCLVKGERVLACAPSNLAVDNMLERVAEFHPGRYKLVRLGHPARVSDSLLAHTLERAVQQSEGERLCQDIRKELQDVHRRLAKGVPDRSERHQLFNSRRELRKELRGWERKSVAEVMGQAQAVFSTCSGAGGKEFAGLDDFDVVIIDEAAQALELACWIPITRAKKLVLAGDHLQLPPVIHCLAARALSVTLLDRMVERWGERATVMLQRQYRMHEDIMHFPSQQLYKGKLVADDAVRHRTLLQLLRSSDAERDGGNEAVDRAEAGEDGDSELLLSEPLLFIDTAGCDMLEKKEEKGESKENAAEASVVAEYVRSLLHAGIEASALAIISPYNAQVHLLRDLLADEPRLEIGSVDGFQGREKEAIVLSMVRSNKKGRVGFLKEHRRTNVAMTRAKRHLCVVGDSRTLSADPFLKAMCAFFRQRDRSISAVELLPSQHLMDEPQVKLNLAAPKPTGEAEDDRNDDNADSGVPPPIEPQGPTALEQFKVDVLAQLEGMKQGSAEHRFPSSLNSKQRKVVHETAEELGLFHVSRGKGGKRYIAVAAEPFQVVAEEGEQRPTKQGKAEQRKDAVVEGRMLGEGSERRAKVAIPDDYVERQRAKAAEYAKKKKQEQRQARNNNNNNNNNAGGRKKKKRNGKKKTNGAQGGDALKARKNQKEEDMFREFKAGTCHYRGCKTKTSLVVTYTACRFCKWGYCTSHALPEIHGCGDAVRKASRQKWLEEGEHYIREGAPKKKLTAEQRKVLANQLKKNINDEARKRKGGRSKSKKKGKGKGKKR